MTTLAAATFPAVGTFEQTDNFSAHGQETWSQSQVDFEVQLHEDGTIGFGGCVKRFGGTIESRVTIASMKHMMDNLGEIVTMDYPRDNGSHSSAVHAKGDGTLCVSFVSLTKGCTSTMSCDVPADEFRAWLDNATAA